MTMLTSTITWCTPCVERARRAHSFTLDVVLHLIGSSPESFHIHLHTIHGAPSLTRFSLSTSTFSPCPSPSTSPTPSCTLSSTTRSSWKACATPPTRRVRTPTTSPLPHILGVWDQQACLQKHRWSGGARGFSSMSRWSCLRVKMVITSAQDLSHKTYESLSFSKKRTNTISQVFSFRVFTVNKKNTHTINNKRNNSWGHLLQTQIFERNIHIKISKPLILSEPSKSWQSSNSFSK